MLTLCWYIFLHSSQNLGESTIPIKKRHHNTSISSDMAPPLVHMNSGSSEASDTTCGVAPSVNLTDWMKRRVMALYRSHSYEENNHNHKLSQSYPSYTDLNGGEESANHFYYPATIENTSGSLVTVVFDVSIEQILNPARSRSSLELASSMGSFGANNNCYQHTYDVAKEEDRYAVIDDAIPDSSKLEKDMFVLYRHSQGLANSASYPSTPTSSTPSSPVNYKSGNVYRQPLTSPSASSNMPAVNRYRLGKIVDVIESSESKNKQFIIQSVVSADGEDTLPLSAVAKQQAQPQQLVINRPNIRLLASPWFEEYKSELGLKSYDKLQQHVVLICQQQHQQQRQSKSFKSSSGNNNNSPFFGEAEQILDKNNQSSNINKILKDPQALISSFSKTFLGTIIY